MEISLRLISTFTHIVSKYWAGFREPKQQNQLSDVCI